jgi:hypothetical protein
MKRMKISGMCAIVVLAVVGLAAVSASAAPEFGRCVAKAGGRFENSNCSKLAIPGKEKFEFLPGAVKNHFTTVIKGLLGTFESVDGSKYTCKGESSGGEYSGGNKVTKVVTKFSGCSLMTLSCKTPTEPEGVVRTAPLEGVLGVEKVGTKSPENDTLALELHPPAGQNYMEFSCAGLPVIVKGSILHPITTNVMSLTTVEKYSATKAKQKPEHFAGGEPGEHILEWNTNGGPFEQFGYTIEETNTHEEELEANSIGM